MSAHIFAAKKNEIADTVLMPGDPLRAKFIAENYLEHAVCYNQIRGMCGYTGNYKGTPVSVQGSGMGMPSMGIYSYELFHEYDVNNIIRIGTAGSFHENVKVGEIVLALAASTDSNWQHTYHLAGTFSPCADFGLLIKAKEQAEAMGLTYHAGNILSSDVFYEDREGWWNSWAKMGCLAVEMEAAALYMNAARLGKHALCICTISNHFEHEFELTAEEREKQLTDMIELALNTAIQK